MSEPSSRRNRSTSEPRSPEGLVSQEPPLVEFAGFPDCLRARNEVLRASFHGVSVSKGSGKRTPDRVHGSPRARPRRAEKPHKAASARGDSAGVGAHRTGMGYCNQPPPRGYGSVLGQHPAGGGKAGVALRELVAGVLRIYKRWISPMLPSACRFAPTCSEYMHDAVHRYGAGKGVWIGLKRMAKCHPFHQGGYDPVR
jgi:hypothetical protein